MRRLALVALVALAACKAEPSFDERYEQAETRIKDKARELDAQAGKAQTAPVADSGTAVEPVAKDRADVSSDTR